VDRKSLAEERRESRSLTGEDPPSSARKIERKGKISHSSWRDQSAEPKKRLRKKPSPYFEAPGRSLEALKGCFLTLGGPPEARKTFAGRLQGTKRVKKSRGKKTFRPRTGKGGGGNRREKSRPAHKGKKNFYASIQEGGKTHGLKEGVFLGIEGENGSARGKELTYLGLLLDLGKESTGRLCRSRRGGKTPHRWAEKGLGHFERHVPPFQRKKPD